MPEVILAKENIRKLLAAGNGDCALLYLCRAAGISEVATGFSEPRLESASVLLRQLGMDESQNPKFMQPAERPEYTEEDVRRQMELPRSGSNASGKLIFIIAFIILFFFVSSSLSICSMSILFLYYLRF